MTTILRLVLAFSILFAFSWEVHAEQWWSIKVSPSGLWIDANGNYFIFPDSLAPGSLDNAAACNTSLIGLDSTHPQFDQFLAMALSAYVTGKTLRMRIS